MAARLTTPDPEADARRRAAAKTAGLYVIIDPEQTAGRDPLWVAEQALLGGATAIQLRDKLRDKGDSLPLAMRLVELCERHGALCIINDHADLTVAAGAHGVHVGQHDLPVAAARVIVTPTRVVGTSNALVEEAIESYKSGADYLAVGAMYTTASKKDTRPAGPQTLRRVREIIPPDGPPIIGIGGITVENVGAVAEAGADGICVLSAVSGAQDPMRAAQELLAAFLQARTPHAS